MKTMLLDQVTWDICLDASGNIAVASEPYALAQDAASACRLFEGELWYDTSQGIPYFDQVLGMTPPRALIENLLEQAAVTVPGIAEAKAVITSIVKRKAAGTLLLSTEAGDTFTASF